MDETGIINLVFGTGATKSTIGTIELDALLDESTSFNSRATQYVVEDGSPISDHISQDSEEVKITGVITSASVSLMDGSGGLSKMFDAKQALRDLHAARETVSIVTGMDVWDDMAIVSCEVSRSSDDGYQYKVDMTLRKIRKAKPSEAQVPEATAKKADAQGKASTSGKKGTGVNGKAGKTKTNAGRGSNNTSTASSAGTGSTSAKAAAKAEDVSAAYRLRHGK